MESTTQTAIIRRWGLFYGWWIVGLGFFLATLSAGSAFYAFGLFIVPFQEDFGWGRGAVSGAISLHFLIVGLSGPIVGRLMDRYGPRYLLLFGLALAGVSYLLLSFISSLLLLYILWGVLAIGTAFFGVVPIGIMVSQWFTQKRGMAMGIAMAGIAFGGLAMAPITGSVIEGVSWQGAARVLGLVLLILPAPFVLFIVRSAPIRVPQPTENDARAAGAPPTESMASTVAWTTKAAIRTPTFWFASGAFFLASTATVGVLQHQASFLRDFALAPTIAALGVGITSGIGGVGKLFFGYISDRVPVRYAALLSFGSQATALTLLLTTQQTWALWIFVVLFGVGMGAIVVLVPLLVAELFGTMSFGTLFGTINLVQGLGLAIGPWAAGRIFDAFGSYTIAFQASLALYAVATLLVFLARRPQNVSPSNPGLLPVSSEPAR